MPWHLAPCLFHFFFLWGPCTFTKHVRVDDANSLPSQRKQPSTSRNPKSIPSSPPSVWGFVNCYLKQNSPQSSFAKYHSPSSLHFASLYLFKNPTCFIHPFTHSTRIPFTYSPRVINHHYHYLSQAYFPIGPEQGFFSFLFFSFLFFSLKSVE